ncbi:hypothetical protein AAVH_32326 [Aphelenchoides avenae]|nr:hypothetical protein AAVH_32326 [Aphelenchus avenae]
MTWEPWPQTYHDAFRQRVRQLVKQYGDVNYKKHDPRINAACTPKGEMLRLQAVLAELHRDHAVISEMPDVYNSIRQEWYDAIELTPEKTAQVGALRACDDTYRDAEKDLATGAANTKPLVLRHHRLVARELSSRQ